MERGSGRSRVVSRCSRATAQSRRRRCMHARRWREQREREWLPRLSHALSIAQRERERARPGPGAVGLCQSSGGSFVVAPKRKTRVWEKRREEWTRVVLRLADFGGSFV